MISKTTTYFIFLFSFSFLLSCSTKTTPSFSISGQVLNTEEKMIILSKVEDIINNKTKVIDTLTIDENGHFNKDYFLEANIYNLTFDKKKVVQLVIDKGQNILISGNHLDSLTVNGSIDTDLLNNYQIFRKASLKRLVTKVRDSIKTLDKNENSQALISELRAVEVENYKIHLFELTRFIQQKMGTSIAIYPTSIRWNSDNLATLEEITSNFKAAHPTLSISEKLEKRIELLQKNTVGSTFSNIEMPNNNGQLISLEKAKGAVTLIDFWASWCPPCRAESALLNELYATYQSKGFEIYGISLDSKKQRWIDAIEKDNRVWTNVSTVEGFKTPIAQEFGITALPTNFLIDANGKIIAVNVHGKALEKALTVLFK